MLLSGKNAVVTGSLRGIGKKTLETFSEQGANVWACAQHAGEEFEKFCADLAQCTGTWVKPVYLDLTDSDGDQGRDQNSRPKGRGMGTSNTKKGTPQGAGNIPAVI